jgi:hypothetical protein
VVVSSVEVPGATCASGELDPPPPLAASATPTLKATTSAGTIKSFAKVDIDPSCSVSELLHRG